MEGALVPFNDVPKQNKNTENMDTSPNFDILSILNELEDNDNVLEQQMVVAVTQVEQNITKTAIMKRDQPT